jgi:hypothetical protein
MILLFKLILAHLLGDFLFQPDAWVKAKEKNKLASWQLYAHAAIHFLLIMVLVADLSFWLWALVLALLHLTVDVLKLFVQTRKKQSYFFIDQLLHVTVICILWVLYKNISFCNLIKNPDYYLVLVTFIYALTQPASIFISSFISRWTTEHNDEESDSLSRAGNWIGILERLFVFVFVIGGRWEAVGFLLTAKSVFRFGDLRDKKDRKLTEYVLIGTLLSFGIAILAGLVFLKIRTHL